MPVTEHNGHAERLGQTILQTAKLTPEAYKAAVKAAREGIAEDEKRERLKALGRWLVLNAYRGSAACVARIERELKGIK